MISKNQARILQRAAERRKLRTRNIRSINDWKQHVQELEEMTLLIRVHNGQWRITPKGRDKLREYHDQEDDGPQQTLDMAST